jgi:multidrug resistance efflux pump
MSWQPVTQRQFWHEINKINQRISHMASQADIDALTAELQNVANDLAQTQTVLQSEIDNLADGNPGLDVSALQQAADALDPAVQKLGSITPTPPPTTPPATG